MANAKVKFTDTLEAGDSIAQKRSAGKKAELKGWRYKVEAVSRYNEFILVSARHVEEGPLGGEHTKIPFKELNMKKNLWVNLTKED